MEALDRALLTLAFAGPLLGLAIGAGRGILRGGLAASSSRGLAVGLIGTVIYGLWRLFLYLTRYDPATGYVGLHKVSVLCLCLIIFVAVGAGVGLLLRLLFQPRTA
ncbi:MAG: hypothetical protein ACE5R4_07315 [Armatimonadota bacterium]